MSYDVVQADVIDWLWSQPADSIDLVFGSPPYEDARTYGIGFKVRGQAWVDWMVEVITAASDACRGMIAFVVAGKTNKYRWSGTPALLQADLIRLGFNLRNPPAFHRIGIPGSGGPDWLRADYETIVCVTRPGKLPWSDNTAMGHPPKWAPGGAMSHRLTDGTRRNQWGSNGSADGGFTKLNGVYRPSHVVSTPGELKRRVTRGKKSGDTVNADSYAPPCLANPGNMPQQTYTADEVAALLAEASSVSHHKVGGNLMGDPIAHENEAPFPESLAEFFVRSFCPPGGLVADPFCGSGTTLAVALKHGRRAVGCDIRPDQVDWTLKRLGNITPAQRVAGGAR